MLDTGVILQSQKEIKKARYNKYQKILQNDYHADQPIVFNPFRD